MMGGNGTTRRVHRLILATAHYFSSINTCHVPIGFPIKKGYAELSGMLSFNALIHILEAFTFAANNISMVARKRERA
jgi:hypothetical protein